MARVLLLTTDGDLAFLLDVALTTAGHDAEAVLPPGAVRARLAQPPPDAVVLEHAPDGGAVELLVAELRSHWPRCPVLLVAAQSVGVADAWEVGQLLDRARPAALLRRPVRIDELLATLEALIRSASRAA